MDDNNPFIIYIISDIYSLLKSHFKELISDNPNNKNIYQNTKNLIMKCVEKYLRMNNLHPLTTRNISDCLSIIILAAAFNNWETCISELIKECMKGNPNLCYLVLRALADIELLIFYKNKDELDEEDNKERIEITQPLSLNDGERMKIKGELIKNKEIVIKFIVHIYKGIKDYSSDKKTQLQFIYVIFDVIKCWSHFELNMFIDQEVASIVYSILNDFDIDRPKSFSEMIMSCISYSKNTKLNHSIEAKEDSDPNQLSEKIFNLINQNEKKGLFLLLEFLLQNLDYFKANNPENMSNTKKELFNSYVLILSSIVENYIFLFFNFSDIYSSKVLEYFKYFLKYKKRKISSYFFEGLGEMRHFINTIYRFSGLDNDQRSEFLNYFMDIFFGVIENCAYNKLDVNNTSLLDKEFLSKNNELDINRNDTESQYYSPKFSYSYFDEISVEEYRNSAGEVFYDVFFIILKNFGDDDSFYFLNEKILSPIYDNNLINKPNFPLIIDVIIFVLCSISHLFFLEEIKTTKTLNAIKNVINTYIDTTIVLKNQRILIDFMVLINMYYQYIVKDQNIFFKIIKFLLYVAKNYNNEKVEQCCYLLLSNISKEKNENMQNDYNLIDEIFNLFKEKYSSYNSTKIVSLKNILVIILSLLGINWRNSGNNLSKDKIEFYQDIIQKIALPINTKLQELLQAYENNLNSINQEFLISEINKSYIIQGEIISILGGFNNKIKNNYLQNYLDNYLFLTKAIMNTFYTNSKLMNNIFDFYEKVVTTLGDNCPINIEKLNDLFVQFLFSDEGERYDKILLILKGLYLSLFKSNELNKGANLNCNNYVLEKYNEIIKKYMDKIKNHSDLNNPKIKEILKILFEFHLELFSKFELNQSDNLLTENFIKFLIDCVTLLCNFEKKVEINEEQIINYLIKSFNTIFENKTFINNKSFYLINSAEVLWNFIYFKQLNATSRGNLVNFYCIFLQYDLNNFCEIFKKLIGNSKKIPNVGEIIEYFIIFKDDSFSGKKMIRNVIEIIQGKSELKILIPLLTLSAKKKLQKI